MRGWAVLVCAMVVGVSCASTGPLARPANTGDASATSTIGSTATSNTTPADLALQEGEEHPTDPPSSTEELIEPPSVQQISAPIDFISVGRSAGRMVLVDEEGMPIQLRGVNQSGTEYACAQGWAIHDTGVTEAPDVVIDRLIEVMVSWEVNAVRVPLNEHCWLDRNGVREGFGGEAYRNEIVRFVAKLRERGMAVVIGLMWGDAGQKLGLRQPPMANRDHSIDMWRSVAETFRDDHGLLFELFGEPSIDDWECWRDGCDLNGYPVAGMQSLVDAVRSAGATQPVIVSGLRYANDLSQWLEFAPTDPANQLAAGFHLYNFNACITVECWDAEIAPIIEVAPVVTTEFGEDLCTGQFIQSFVDWADPQELSYLAWGFNSQDSCSRGPALLTDDAGSTTISGEIYRNHLLTAASAR